MAKPTPMLALCDAPKVEVAGPTVAPAGKPPTPAAKQLQTANTSPFPCVPPGMPGIYPPQKPSSSADITPGALQALQALQALLEPSRPASSSGTATTLEEKDTYNYY